MIPHLNLCEAAVHVKRFLYLLFGSLQIHVNCSASSMSAFCPRSVVGDVHARRIVGFGSSGGTIFLTASDCDQVQDRARRAML